MLPAIVGRTDKAAGGGAAAGGDDVRTHLSRGLRRTLELWKSGRVRPFYSEPFGDPVLARRLELDTYFIVEVPPGTDTGALSDVLAALGGEVVAADVDVIGGVTGDAPPIPNDPNFGLQYHLHNDEPDEFLARCMNLFDADIDGPEAWAMHTGDPSVIIAILDSGVSPHVDFVDRMIPGRNVVPGRDPNDTHDGCYFTPPSPLQGHGTHVTGIAAATGNNGVGVAGVNWGASIMPVKVLDGPGVDDDCNGSIVETAAGILWAADNGADVINMSLQFYSVSALNRALTENAVNYATELGVVLVAATGNSRGADQVAMPAQLVSTIAVSGVNECDEIATNGNGGFISNYGVETDISAHGSRIYSTFRNNTYGLLSGTSMATPSVSGAAGLIKSFAPDLTVTSIRNVLFSSSEDRGAEGWDKIYGHGRLNAHEALLAAIDWPQVTASSPSNDVIDARIPNAPNDDAVRFGWSQVELTFRGDASALQETDFTVAQEGGIAGAPGVAGVFSTEEPDVLVVALDRAIDPKAWTSVTHDQSGTGVRLGFLPGDVSGNGSVTEGDLEALLVELEFPSEPPLPESSTDINRSGALTPADLIDLIDLMNGAELYEPYLGAALPR